MSSNYFHTYAQDLEQEPFDPVDFVERLTWRLTGGGDAPIDPDVLHKSFEQEIANLQMLSDQYQVKIQTLQNQCREEEEEFFGTLERLQDENADGFDKLKGLEGKINTVAAKVVHLGDQLESLNAPRARAHEAFTLMRHFNEFLADQPLESDVFHDPYRLLEAGTLIVKLAAVAAELPEDQFKSVQTRISYQYDEIEKLLLEEFGKTYRMGNASKLKSLAEILHQFKGYSRCTNTYVEMVQIGEFRGPDVFADMLSLCKKAEPQIKDIFPDPEAVMAKLVLNIFHGKIQDKLNERLEDCTDKESYLTSLYDLYAKTQKLEADLAQSVRVGSDRDYVPALIRALFAKYVEPYMSIELKHLENHCSQQLRIFYEKKNHQKRTLPAGGLKCLLEDCDVVDVTEC